MEISAKEKLKNDIIDFAKTLRFDVVGFTSTKLDKKYINTFEKWLKKKYEGKMSYLQKFEERKNPSKLLPHAKSMIVLGINYYHKQSPLKKGHGRIARYAYGRDYHKIIQKKLKILENFIKEKGTKFLDQLSTKRKSPFSPKKIPTIKTVETKSYVDTGPVLERAFAEQSDIGTVGKNSCLITKEFGSWIFLAEIITTLDLGISPTKNSPSAKCPHQCHDSPFAGESSFSSRLSHFPSFSICGTCTRCIDSCPTKAIISPGIIDARRCISYLTIENKGKIPEKFTKIIKKEKRLFGCDICQEVCPHNCRAKQTTHEEFLNPAIAGDSQNIKKILSIKTDKSFLARFAGSPLMRAKRKGLQRNAKIQSS